MRIEAGSGVDFDETTLSRLRGQVVTVTGLRRTAADAGRLSERLAVQAIRLADRSSSSNIAIAGDLPFVTVLCRFADIGAVPQEPSYYQSLVSGPGYPSLDDFWREVSYQNISLAGSEVAGWFDLPHPRSYYVSNETPEYLQHFTGLQQMYDCLAAADTTVHFPDFAGINLVFNGYAYYAMGGHWLLTLDGVTRDWLATQLPDWASQDRGTWAHEMGHAFNFGHSGGGATGYADVWDLMGGPAEIGPNTISHFLDVNGWVAQSRIATVYPGSSLTVTLDRLTSPVGLNTPLMVKVPRPSNGTGWLTVEVRRQFGYDAPIPGNAVLIHEVKDWKSPVILGPNGPSDHAGAMWNTGETFIDAASGIRVLVLAETATTATVLVANPRSDNWLTFDTLAGLAGSAGASDGTGAAARFNGPSDVVVDDGGSLYVADFWNHTIRLVTPTGDVSVFAGQNGSCGSLDGARLTARFCQPTGIALDASGTLYVAEAARIRRITLDGQVSTVASLPFTPVRIAVSGAGTLYVTGGDGTVRTVSPAGVVTTLAGTAGQYGAVDGVGSAARFMQPRGIAVDAAGVAYVADYYSIRRITPAGAVTTLAGTPHLCGAADGPGNTALFCQAHGLAMHPDGSLYVTDRDGQLLRRVTTDGVVTTLAGQWLLAGSEDGPSLWSRFNQPEGIALDRQGQVYVADTGNHTIRRTVANRPRLTTSTAALRFGATRGSHGDILHITSAQRVGVSTEPASVGWSVTSEHPWAVVTGGSGTGAGEFTVSIDTAQLPAGQTDLTTNLSVYAPGADLTTPMTVWLTIAQAATSSTAPFGTFDTPLQNTADVTGSIPVTGWALDDIEVSRVQIFRDAVSPEPIGNQVYVGDAVQVYGARPDVAEAYPLLPMSARAGWGYMLLTNMLPNQGNGAFTLHAYADDLEGHRVLLGSRTFTGDNLHATRPFGAIDTPGQGATSSGGSYVNFGWALTPQPCAIPVDGSTIWVFVDGVAVGHPGALSPRADITALFPGYANTENAVGALILNTTGYANGVHTIAWSVTDSCSRADGIGSRYFTILNGGASTLRAAAMPGPAGGAATTLSRDVRRSAGDRGGPVYARRGYDDTRPFEVVPLRKGTRTVTAREIERVVVRLTDPPEEWSRWTYEGYLVVGDDLRPLPIGSSLDADAGVFYWQPGPGFVGAYNLAFFRTSAADGTVERLAVRVVLRPKHPGPSDVLLAIDLPQPGGVSQPFLVAGWAIDRGAVAGTGVDTVHVWAYPVTPSGYGDPFFLGVARYGDARADLGAYYGGQFTDSAYGLVAAGLAPGTYDVAVFPHSVVTGEFAGARVVRVTVR